MTVGSRQSSELILTTSGVGRSFRHGRHFRAMASKPRSDDAEVPQKRAPDDTRPALRWTLLARSYHGTHNHTDDGSTDAPDTGVCPRSPSRKGIWYTLHLPGGVPREAGVARRRSASRARAMAGSRATTSRRQSVCTCRTHSRSETVCEDCVARWAASHDSTVLVHSSAAMAQQRMGWQLPSREPLMPTQQVAGWRATEALVGGTGGCQARGFSVGDLKPYRNRFQHHNAGTITTSAAARGKGSSP